ncbi:MAG: hypothetical protein DCF16_09140 [Alphaproteobacteria bacterium]|nr:MAG: hypothetical protein DCF16_09140 [Alphaproteobacteria bacterium]
MSGGAGAGQPAAIVIQAGRAKGAKPEEIYRAWLELAEARIAGEQVVLGGYALAAGDQVAGEAELTKVLAFFDGLAAQVFTRQTDVGELSNYMAADARRWRELLRGLRQRSAPAKETPRYHQVTRALAAAEFVASEPINDEERTAFSLDNIRADVAADGRSITIVADLRGRTVAPRAVPNIAVCLRDANGDVCGEAVLAPPVEEIQGERSEGFTATLDASREITDVEVSFTRRAVG